MQNANVLTFIQEMFQRLFTKSPTFFKVWTFISGALVLITGLPAFIDLLHINGFQIPDLWNAAVTKAVGFASSGVLLMSLLTTQSKPSGATENGEIIKSTDQKKLPFTAAKEQKIIDTKELPQVEVKTVIN